MQVWTASHCISPERFAHLKDAIDSVQKHGLHHRISISGCTLGQLQELQDCLGTNGEVIFSKKKSQLEHLKILYRTSRSPGKTRILFLDDDDLLLRLPFEPGRVQGSQILFEDEIQQKLGLTECIQMLCHSADTGQVLLERYVVDFSGYICFKFDFEVFLRYGTVRVQSMADLDIMQFLDDSGAVCPQQPFIGHRLWIDNDEKDWVQGLRQQFLQIPAGMDDNDVGSENEDDETDEDFGSDDEFEVPDSDDDNDIR